MSSSHIVPWSHLQEVDFPICDLVVYPTPHPASTNLSDKLCTRGPVAHYLTTRDDPNLLTIGTEWHAEYNPVSMRWVRKTVHGIDRGGIVVNTLNCFVRQNGEIYLIVGANNVVMAALVPQTSSHLKFWELL